MTKIISILITILLTEAIAFFLLFSSVHLEVAEPKTAHLRNNYTDAEIDLPEAIQFNFQNRTWQVDKSELKDWLVDVTSEISPTSPSLVSYFHAQTNTTPPQENGPTAVKMALLNEQKVGDFLVKLANQINQAPQSAQLEIKDERASVFLPHQTGLSVDLAQARQEVLAALSNQGSKIELNVVSTPPKVTLTHLNDLGIQELLASGQSDFSGSSRSRITNIRVGAARYNGLIVKAGEEFSFNKNLGPITAENGYWPEIVIKPEGLTPELGGGLCQVSTTAFRAAFFAGLPITQRRNHSFPVRYYEWISDNHPKSVGLDATIYPGAQDLRFLNDTAGAILIWTRMEGTRLYFDFYGRLDDRQVIVDGPHEYDRRASGAVKAKVKRVVIKNGESAEQEITSNYVSPNLYPKLYTYPKPVNTN